MSLISTKNFLTPLNNRIHLVSIVLLTIAFAMLRLSGCAVRSVSTSSDIRSNTYTFDDNVIDEQEPVEKSYQSSKEKTTTEGLSDFDDIERTLGLK